MKQQEIEEAAHKMITNGMWELGGIPVNVYDTMNSWSEEYETVEDIFYRTIAGPYKQDYTVDEVARVTLQVMSESFAYYLLANAKWLKPICASSVTLTLTLPESPEWGDEWPEYMACIGAKWAPYFMGVVEFKGHWGDWLKKLETETPIEACRIR